MTPKQPSKKTRLTLNKQIAVAPTHAKKWELALHGGKPPTAIQSLPMQAFGLQNPSAHGAEWQQKAIEQAKQRFADLLFPALMKDNPQPFEELLAAMAHRRKTTVSLDEFVRRQQEASKMKLSKKEMGRRLRLALLNLSPDDLTSMRDVLNFLARFNTEFSDESHVRRVMSELNIQLLKPGETVFFYFSVVDLRTGQPKEWHCPRKIIVGKSGTVTNYGMSRKEYDELLGCKSHRVQPLIRPGK